MSSPPPADWQLPRGMTRGLWEYAQADHISEEYDKFFEFNRLFDFDEAVSRTPKTPSLGREAKVFAALAALIAAAYSFDRTGATHGRGFLET